MTELLPICSPITRIPHALYVPGDKSISHRAVLFASLSDGRCIIENFLPGEDCLRTIAAMRSLGVTIEEPDPTTLIVHGTSGKFKTPNSDIDCGNSGTTMRLLAGILAGQGFDSRLTGDSSLSARPMQRIIEPLTQMRASIVAEGQKNGKPTAPLRIEGRALNGITYSLPISSAQVKSAILLAGLFANGQTTIIEPALSRDHTERLLTFFGVPVQREPFTTFANAAKPQRISVPGGSRLRAKNLKVPGDISSAAFWLCAAAALPGAKLRIKDVGLNPSRTGFINVLLRMGVSVMEVIENEETAAEPMGFLEVMGTPHLKATTIAGSEIPLLIDELPSLAVLAALAKGTTHIRDAQELRVKETDRIAALATNLRAMGIHVEEHPDGLSITGGTLKGARLSSFGDHRIAMAFAIAGLFARGDTTIEGADCIAISYPNFKEVLYAFKNESIGYPER